MLVHQGIFRLDCYTDFQSKLTAIKHGTLEGICLFLEICLRSLSRRNQVFENRWQETLPSLGFDK